MWGEVTALEIADKGDVQPFCRYLGNNAVQQLHSLIITTKLVLDGSTRYQHGNGGVTNNGIYYPPEHDSKDEGMELEI